LVFTASLLGVQHLKGIVLKVGRQVGLCPLGKALNGIASTFEWVDW